MPLVRIITRLHEYPTELVRDLRTRGFNVETCLPPTEEQEAADLEITLDQCSPENMSEAISHALENRDVVIVSNGRATSGRVRSIGMVVLSSDEDFQTSRKTAVPAQFNEIYTALLRGRAQSRSATISANWESMRQRTQQLNGTWKYFRTVGKNLGDLGSRTFSEAGIWMKAKRSSLADRRRLRAELEPDLVPSMFSLSAEVGEVAEEPTPASQAENVTPIRSKKPFKMWKPDTAGVAAILAVTLWVHGSSRLKADQVAKEPSVQTAGPSIQTVQKIEKPDPASGSKVLAKSNPDEDHFQEVVVRHFDQPAAPRATQKDGVKRRVVVD
jgi:hypothetical protein